MWFLCAPAKRKWDLIGFTWIHIGRRLGRINEAPKYTAFDVPIAIAIAGFGTDDSINGLLFLYQRRNGLNTNVFAANRISSIVRF